MVAWENLRNVDPACEESYGDVWAALGRQIHEIFPEIHCSHPLSKEQLEKICRQLVSDYKEFDRYRGPWQ